MPLKSIGEVRTSCPVEASLEKLSHRMDIQKPVIQVKKIDDLEKCEIVRSVIKHLQGKGLSYQQAVDLLKDTKDHLKNIPINIFSQSQ